MGLVHGGLMVVVHGIGAWGSNGCGPMGLVHGDLMVVVHGIGAWGSNGCGPWDWCMGI